MSLTWALDPTAPLHYPGVSIEPDWGIPVYHGDHLPSGLQGFSADKHSWEKFVQDTALQPVPASSLSAKPVPLRAYQRAQARRIKHARTSGSPGYLLNYPLGSGKTPISIRSLADGLPDGSLLVLTKLNLVRPWRVAIDRFGSKRHRWVVTTPERLWRLFEHPSRKLHRCSSDKRLKLASEMGRSRVRWNGVVVDESQMLAHSDSVRFRLFRRLERDYTVYATATGFTTPGETAYLADVLAFAAGVEPPTDLDGGYSQWLRALGMRLNVDANGRWQHSINHSDVSLLTRLLYDSGVGATADVVDLGLPAQARSLRPIELSPEDTRSYNQAWLAFRDEQGFDTSATIAPSSPMTAALRKLQQASLLRVPAVADMIADYIADGFQVAVPMFFLDSVHALTRATYGALTRRKLPNTIVEMTGEDLTARGSRAVASDRREVKRHMFQTGRAMVAIFNGYEGINLQAGEKNVDGKGIDGNTVPRITVMADILTGGKRTLQAEGRAHRDGQESLAVYPYAAGTIELEWLAKVFRSAANTRALARATEDTRNLIDLAAQLEAESADASLSV